MRFLVTLLLIVFPGYALANNDALFKYRWERPPDAVALRDVELRVFAGEATIIAGPDGAGKSTLINIKGDLLNPTGGKYKILVVDEINEKYGEFEVSSGLDFGMMPNGQMRMREGLELKVGDIWINPRNDTSIIGQMAVLAAITRKIDRVLGDAAPPPFEEGILPPDLTLVRLEAGIVDRVEIGRPISFAPMVFIADEPVTKEKAKPIKDAEVATSADEAVSASGAASTLATEGQLIQK